MLTDSLPVTRLAACCLPDALLGGISLNGLGLLKDNLESPLLEPVEATCSQCGAPLGKVAQVWQNICACDACRDKYLDREKMNRVRDLWQRICPAGFQDTILSHPGFPLHVWNLPILQKWDGGQSLLFLGESRTGKTRTAFLLLKRALLKGMSIAVLWPEDLREFAGLRTMEPLRALALHDVVLLDDTLQAVMGEDRLVEIAKQIVDLFIRNRRTMILTSQLGGSDTAAEVGRYGGPSAAQLKRVSALIERIREAATVVPFAAKTKPTGAAEDQPF